MVNGEMVRYGEINVKSGVLMEFSATKWGLPATSCLDSYRTNRSWATLPSRPTAAAGTKTVGLPASTATFTTSLSCLIGVHWAGAVEVS